MATPLPYACRQPCNCTSCEHVRLTAFHGPGLYRAIALRWEPTQSGTTTWTLDAFVWGPRVPAGQAVWVEREVERGEKGGHLDGVVIWLIEDGADFSKRTRACTSKRWIEPA